MKIYIEKKGNKILNIDLEKFSDNTISINADNEDDFFNQIKHYGVLSEELIEKLEEMFKITNDNSLEKYNIKHWVSNRSFGELIDMFENEEIIIPHMQRSFVWDSLRSSRLVESILIGLPIPPLFLLEIGNSKYELIDGYQRLTTLYNFIKGNSWSGIPNAKKNSIAKLSKKVSIEIAGKTFKDLDTEYQRILKRSTVPLIEFKQLDPDNNNSKYLIFERINTGSEKLNAMQIRKSLSYGKFMESLYLSAERNEKFIELFSSNNIKKDMHIEAFLRIYVMIKVFKCEYETNESGILNILNNYCEDNKEQEISNEYCKKFDFAIDSIYEIFKQNNLVCRRVEKAENGNYLYKGTLNISILEAMIGVIIDKNLTVNAPEVEKKYQEVMYRTMQDSINKIKDNPFSVSTGSDDAIKSRFKICEEILVDLHEDF